MDETVAAAARVTKRFGATLALQDVSLSVSSGRVHGLLGRNGSGKSTLVSLLTGLNAPDAGSVSFDGQPAPAMGRRPEWTTRVGCVYQHSTLLPDLTVAENLLLGQERGPYVSWRRRMRTAEEMLAPWGLDIDPARPVRRLKVNERQLVEIVRETQRGSRFLILDEPTARLNSGEIDQLFSAVARLRDEGTGVLFISHYLQETFEICDDLTVLRDGRVALQAPCAAVDERSIVAAIVGPGNVEPLAVERLDTPVPEAPVVVEVRGLGVDTQVDGVAFDLRPGECVGLAGINGSGNRTVAECLFGLANPDRGTYTIDGRRRRFKSPRAALRAGVGYVPADRHHNGFVPAMSVEENITLPALRQFSRVGIINGRSRKRRARELFTATGVAGGGLATPVTVLSGGNQQKVVIGRALAREPKFLVLVEPTAGVDIASAHQIFDTIRDATERGVATLIVSDRPEDLALCGRVLVMSRGTIATELGPGWSEEDLVSAMEGVRVDVSH